MNRTQIYSKYKNQLDELNQTLATRELLNIKKQDKYIIWKDKKLLNLSSNDYLGIAANSNILEKFYKIGGFSLGSTSSRLLTGSSTFHFETEDLLAKMYKKEKALIFNSGYHSNVGIMSALLSKNDVVFSDKLNHASILDGIKLSDSKMYRYKHLDYEHLEELLKKYRHGYETAVIISESLFSMDGDIANIKKLIELKNKYHAILVIDEAHAFGIYGQNGLGLAEEQNCINDVDIIIATFGKAIGSVGAFCVGDKILVDYLINKARPLIFSTALPEINLAFSHYVLTNILPTLANQRKNLLLTAKKLREKLTNIELITKGNSHIVPVILGENEKSITTSKALIQNGYYLLPIRHPTVALNSSRIRISLRADISYEEIEEIPTIIKQALNDFQ